MPGAVGEIFGNFGGGGFLGYATMAFWIIFGIVVLLLCAFLVWFMYKRKRNWNIKVEIKIPRSDGKLVNAEWGKGEYNSEKGVVFIKRKGKKAIPMKPFNPSEFLQGSKNILTVVQLSPGHYIPIKYDSFLNLKDVKTKQTLPVVELISDFSESKAWRNTFERESKQAFSIKNLLVQYAPYISIGLVIILWGIQFLVLYMKIT